MAGEKIIEQPKIEKIPAAADQKSEAIKTAETTAEKAAISPEKPKENIQPREKSGEGGIRSASSAPSYQQRRILEIDNILAEGLNEVFLKMNPQQQKEFKAKGEETAVKISGLLNKTKVSIGKIIALIRRWLKLIPGVNKFFLEQEAKIKGDKIIRMKDKF